MTETVGMVAEVTLDTKVVQAREVPALFEESQLLDSRDEPDWIRIVAAVVSLFGFILVIISGIFGWSNAREVFVVFSGYIGLGTAPLQLMEGYQGLKYVVLSIGIGLATVSLIGFLLLEVQCLGTVNFGVYRTLLRRSCVSPY